MSIKKQFLKSKPECKVTFRVEPIDGLEMETVKVIGDFNKWSPACEPMKKLKSGEFSQTLNLETGKRVQFRYLVNESVWFNDPEADAYIDCGVSVDQNCIIDLEE